MADTDLIPRHSMRFALLEPIRGIAALWVFCFHFHFSTAFRAAFPSLHAIMKVGDLGVPMFFVVSGYCIAAAARSAIRTEMHWSHFLFRRLKRIYPPFWFSIAVVISIPFVIEVISSAKTGQYTPPSPAHLNYGFLNYTFTDWVLVASLAKVFQVIPGATSLSYKFTTINAVYWTLAIEVQFYIVISSILFAFPKVFYQAVIATTAVSVAVSFLPGVNTSGLFFPYWTMFALGVLLCWLLERGVTPDWMFGSRHLAIAGSSCMAMLAVFFWFSASGMSINSLVFAGLFSVLLFLLYSVDRVYAAKCEKSSAAVVRWPVVCITAIGAMSYSLYLLHGRVQFLAMQIIRQVMSVDTIAFDVMVIVATCATCYIFYWCCERPFVSSGRSAKS